MSQNVVLPFENLFVMRFTLDHFIYVLLGDSYEIWYSILIANDFPLNINGEKYMLSPERLSEVGPLLTLFMQQVRSAYYTQDDETLFIEFANGATIVVNPHTHYEAWNINTISANAPVSLGLYAKFKE